MQRTALFLVSLFSIVPAAAAQWSTPVAMPNLNTTGSDVCPCPTLDGLTLYFVAYLPTAEIYRTTRTKPFGSLGTPALVTELNSTGQEYSPCPRFDDLEIFFTTDKPGGGGGLDLWRADRPSTAVVFNTPVPVLELNSTTSDYGASLTFDALRIYFNSSRPGGLGGTDIWTATRPNWSSPFGTPTPVTELNTASTDRDPHVSPDGLVMFFMSNRPGGPGGNDLWMASRLDLGSPFGNITNVTALNTPVLDYNPGFAVLYDEIFFASSRPGGLGADDLYSARFTGLLGSGIAGTGSTQDLRFSDPSSPGRVYVAASSRGNWPGIPIDSRVLPLNFDLLLQLTIGGLPPILTGYVGLLDQDGIASGRISFVNFPGFTGLRFSSAFVVLDPSGPSGIKTISNAHEVLVQ